MVASFGRARVPICIVIHSCNWKQYAVIVYKTGIPFNGTPRV